MSIQNSFSIKHQKTPSWKFRRNISILLPTSDGSPLRFKKLFGTEVNKDLLIDFLNELLKGKEQIEDLTYLNSENLGKTKEELSTHFDKWLYVLKNLPKLQARPKPLQERIFKKIFEVAEIVKFNKKEMNAYEQSLKMYRDNQNTMQYAVEKVKRETEERTEKVTREEIARLMKKDGDPLEKIARTTGLSQEQIEKL